MKLGFGICGSFCNHAKALITLQELVDKGYDVTCFVTKEVQSTSTRFGNADEFMAKLEKISKNKVVTTIVEAEQYGPKYKLDCFIVLPSTAVVISKLANGLYDDAVTLGVKAHLRNNRPVVIAVASNDLLGISASNLAKLLNYKYFYFVPFGQDDYIKKTQSMVADFSLAAKTIELALEGKQIQPILLPSKKGDED